MIGLDDEVRSTAAGVCALVAERRPDDARDLLAMHITERLVERGEDAFIVLQSLISALIGVAVGVCPEPETFRSLAQSLDGVNDV